MLIHSDIISVQDIRSSIPSGCYLAGHYDRHENWSSLHILKSRKRVRSYSVRLSSSSPYNMANLPDKSATWDEWGIFIAKLFDIDPHAIIGVYQGRNNFIEVTQREHERVEEWRPDLRKWHKAPWLYA